MQIIFGLFAGIAVALAAWRLRALTISGALAAAVTGGLIFGLGGWQWAVLLLAFFISSSALSKSFARRKTAFDEKFSKGSRRDWGQVLANGGLAALTVIAYSLFPQPWLWAAFAGTLAAVNADTWATELGVLSRTEPVLIISGEKVERGTSGGISRLGTVAALGGAALIGILAGAFWGAYPLGLAATFGGLAGSLFDSLLGATVQAIYHCPACQKETERHPQHLCGTATVHLRGWRWMSNDWVNGFASLCGALTTVGIWLIWVSGLHQTHP